MRYLRLYAGPDGESHLEELDIELNQRPDGSGLSTPRPATGAIFQNSPAGQVMDWHPAPRRQFVVTLAGEGEVEASDGEVRRLTPGTILLVEDVTGKGHRTRSVGAVDRQSLVVPLHDAQT